MSASGAHGVSTINDWYTREGLIRAVPVAETLASGDRTIDLMMAARSLW
jgi:hypothetical protein